MSHYLKHDSKGRFCCWMPSGGSYVKEREPRTDSILQRSDFALQRVAHSMGWPMPQDLNTKASLALIPLPEDAKWGSVFWIKLQTQA